MLKIRKCSVFLQVKLARQISINQKNVSEHKLLNKFLFECGTEKTEETDNKPKLQSFKKLFNPGQCKLLTSASSEEGFPPQNGCTIEIAFIGRSNCGLYVINKLDLLFSSYR